MTQVTEHIGFFRLEAPFALNQTVYVIEEYWNKKRTEKILRVTAAKISSIHIGYFRGNGDETKAHPVMTGYIDKLEEEVCESNWLSDVFPTMEEAEKRLEERINDDKRA